MAESMITKNCKKRMIICKIISIILSFLPIIIFTIKAFVEGTPTHRLTMGVLFIFAGVLTAINILNKYSLRSTTWILLLGVYICLKNITPLIVIIAICTIVDEIIVTPLYKNFKGNFKINKEMDKRL